MQKCVVMLSLFFIVPIVLSSFERKPRTVALALHHMYEKQMMSMDSNSNMRVLLAQSSDQVQNTGNQSITAFLFTEQAYITVAS